MRGWRHIATGWAVAVALVLAAPAAALADSAGDQQYIDPLAGNTTSTASHPPPTSSSPAPSSSSSASAPAPVASASSPATTPAPSAASAPTTTPTAASTAADPQPTLPYTGLNVWLCAAVGLGLVGAGLALRRLARAP